MTPDSVVDLARQAAVLAVLLGLPAAVTAAVIGLLMGIAQAVTSIQDQSLAQALKIVGVLVVVMLSGAWIGNELMAFGTEVFRNFPAIVRR